jgi:hypothetical protein
MQTTNTNTETSAVKATRTYAVTVFNDGGQEIHACGCSHKKSVRVQDRYDAQYHSTNIKDLCREIALEYNHDLAGDHDMTPEEYIDSGMAWDVSTSPDAHIRIMPCVKFFR